MSLNLLNGNSEALSLLDWFQITNQISSLSHFEITQNNLNTPPVFCEISTIEKNLKRLEDYLSSFDEFSLLFNSRIRMLPSESLKFSLVKDLHKAKFFETTELNFFALLGEIYIETFSSFKEIEFKTDYSLHTSSLQKIRRLFLNPLREFIDFSGNANYEKHPLLKKLYAEVLALEHDLRITIQKISKSEVYAPKLQMESYDIINDRYVLAIKSDSYNSDLGPIVARSQSGMTLFVEPYDVREKGNKRIHLLAEIESTILKLTIELSKIAHTLVTEFELIAQWVLELDYLNTAATYSIKNGLCRPKLTKEFKFEFNGLFHPLLKNPVKNDLLIDSYHKGLIISGPNTGGKTVALKCLSLSILFTHLGLFVPATFAELNPVSHLFYFSHDHQNLAEGLSSFASEAKYYLELLQELSIKNLVIIDEIFNSTSSEEASALAIGFLEEIHYRSNSKVVISTHHQVLKTFMHARQDYVSAHVGFDFDANRPTYKLIIGEPGSSLAFKIFDNLSEKFGLKTKISERAKELLDKKQVTYEQLLQELSQKKIELDKTLNLNKSIQTELKNQKSSMEGILFLEREKILNEYTKKMKNVFDQAETVLNRVKAGDINNKRTLLKEIVSVQSVANKEIAAQKKSDNVDEKYSHYRHISFEDIFVGMTVFSLNFKKDIKVTLLNPRKKEVQIQHGAVTLWVSAGSLRWPTSAKPTVQQISINIDRKIRGDIEIDCRGMRLEEFQNTCRSAIEEVFSGEIPFVTIIHGHGDGILKNWLRSFLKKENRELHFENIEGNDGCTKISLN